MSSTATLSLRHGTPSIFTRTFMLGILGSLSMYLASWENADRAKDVFLEKHRGESGDTFDFIIVGAGTAGSILANRLSEKYKVLLLEAGGEPHPFQAVPLLSNYLLNYAQLDWRHVTMPQEQAFRGTKQSRASISQGRGLGGSSNLDYMMYLRGHPKDYDSWADTLGDSSWSYRSVLKHFKSLEQYVGPWSAEFHGDSGDMKVQQPAYTGLGDTFCKAAQQNGYVYSDLNGLLTEGCDILTYPTKKGYRDSVYNSFLKGAKDRWNLVIHKYAHVNKVLIKGLNNVAYGVEYDRHGKSHVAHSKKEVIISAGAIQTPKILMLSGIGPKADLDSIGIPVISDVPVGQNLQDHLSVFLGPFFVDPGKSLNTDRDVSASSVLALARGNGPLTSTGFQAAAIISSGLEKLHSGRNWPDLQLTMYGLAHHKSADEDFSHAYQLSKPLLQKYFENSKGVDSFSIVVSGGRPKSTGTVKLLNRNPYAPLIIDPHYMDKVYDVVVMVDGVKKALRIVENSTAFREMHAGFTRDYLPGCERFRYRSDAYFECYVKTMSISLGNVAGTAPMGTVLDSKLQVKGVNSLRVVDASVMPSIVTSSTAATVMMIAEKGAELVLKQWQGTASVLAEDGVLKESNSVFGQLKANATKIKGNLDASKVLLDTLKFVAAESNVEPSLEKLNLDDLQKLSQNVESLAALLGGSPENDTLGLGGLDDNYTGSFDLGLGNDTLSSISGLLNIGPMLKKQFGGLFTKYFGGGSTTAKPPPKKVSTPKGSTSVKIPIVSSSGKGSTLKTPIVPSAGGKGSSLKIPIVPSGKSFDDSLKFIQGMIDELDNITSTMTSVKSSTSMKTSVGSKNNNKINNMTLEDIFGMIGGAQDELEEYLLEEKTTSKPKPVNTTPKSKPVSTTSKATTPPPTTTTARSNSTTTTVTPRPTTTTTVAPSREPSLNTRSSTTERSDSLSIKLPMIDYAYELVSSSSNQKSKEANSPLSAILPILSSSSSPHSNYKVTPTPKSEYPTKPPTTKPSLSPAELRKLKSLEILSEIRHDTLAKVNKHMQNHYQKQKYQPTPEPKKPVVTQPTTPHPFQTSFDAEKLKQQFPLVFQSVENSRPSSTPPPTSQSYSLFEMPSYNPTGLGIQQQQHQQQVQGLLPPPQFYYSKPTQLDPVNNLFQRFPRPGGFVRPMDPTLIPNIDPADLRSAVSSIINVNYAPKSPPNNPFQSIIGVLRNSPTKQTHAESSVLKSLQLRSNVDKLLNFPYIFNRPSPISITHRPTPPPSTTTEPPPDPSDASIFAPLHDYLKPFEGISDTFRPMADYALKPMKDALKPLSEIHIVDALKPLQGISDALKPLSQIHVVDGLKPLSGFSGIPGISNALKPLSGISVLKPLSGITSALQPLSGVTTRMMKAPLQLFSNPFGTAVTTTTAPTPASSLNIFPSIFSQRMGPMEVAESQHASKAHRPTPPQRPSPPLKGRSSLSSVLPKFFMGSTKPSTPTEISPELFLLALANLTSDLPKPFVLEPSKSFGKDAFSETVPEKGEEKTSKKHLGQSISDILSHLKNHHFASIAATSAEDDSADSSTPGSVGSNSANEILNINYSRGGAQVGSKDSVSSTATPKTKTNPPVEFHKSPWAKEPVEPKSLYFKIKIV